MNKLDLQMCSQNGTHSYVGDLLYRRVNTYPSKITKKKKMQRKNSPELILYGQHKPDTKNLMIILQKKRKKQADIIEEHRCKNPQ